MVELIQSFGYYGVFLTIFVEIALMVFPLPGDTLLFATGILTDSGVLSFWHLVIVASFASFVAGQTGYFIGTKIDKNLLLNNRFYKVKPEYIDRTEKFFEKYGFYAVVLSRYVPIVRNFISQIMGIIKYDKKKFFIANVLASMIWPITIISMGHMLGKIFPNIITYAEYGMIVVLVVLGGPIVIEFIKSGIKKK